MNSDSTCYCGSKKQQGKEMCYECNEFLSSTDDITERIEFVTQKIKNNDFRTIASDD